MKDKRRKDSDSLIANRILGATTQVTDEEIAYYREHPDQIDEVTAPLNIHKFFLFAGTIIGIGLVALAKFFKYSSVLSFFSPEIQEFFVDLVFEIGVALLGSVIVAYILGVVLNRQQENAKKWRAEIRSRIEQEQKKDNP